MLSSNYFHAPYAHITVSICVLLFIKLSHASEAAIHCLSSIKASLQDPNNYFETWNFANGTLTQICNFNGIDCWHENDNKVLNLKLSGMGLRGEFPLGLINCSSMTGLDLSSNELHGQIPVNISLYIGLLTSLDLSSNHFSGEIPVDLANCTFLNTLKLDNNRLTGQIPWQIGQLGRLKSFSVARNQLSGPVPGFYNSTAIGADSYEGNPGLCGGPGLPLCMGLAGPRTLDNATIIGAAVGCPLGFALGFWCYLYCTRFTNKKRQKKKQKQKQQQRECDPLCNKWTKSIKRAERVKISMFGKSVPRMSFHDLMKATNDFSRENIIVCGSTGTTYKLVLQDRTSFLVKRLRNIHYAEKEFVSEVVALGNMKHRNLTPLVGFCLTKKERLLVYKDMPNGTLHDKLHILNVGDKIMHWPLRLQIALRAAEGFAWLHSMGLVHGDIDPKCILLDEGYEPRISDFLPTNRLILRLSNSQEGDVYSFGVVLLELVTREKLTYVARLVPDDFGGNLVGWILGLSSSSKLEDVVDGFLVEKGFDDEILQVLEVACVCMSPIERERPTMREVCRLLRGVRRRCTTEHEISVLSDDDEDADHDELVEFVVDRDV